ncbi:MAG TPA: GPW/gp25 family protein [Flavisolibacter sp.]|nr:GPW/gp25 family protein [Flavisolibacter sp.]
MSDYLKLPLRFSPFFEKRNLGTCSLKESIARNLHLLITTSLGENKQDLQYGAAFWDYDYDIHLSNDSRREIIIQTIRKQVERYERRLSNITVEVNVKQAEYVVNKNPQLRRRIELVVTGYLIRTNEFFNFQTGFFIGPLLLD